MTDPTADRPIVFLDLETTGLLPVPDDHIWEFAAVRRQPDGTESTYHCFVRHDLAKAERLPESFRADHDARYAPELALSIPELVGLCKLVFAGKPHVVGAVPNFDTERLAAVLGHYGIDPLWHYHLRDVETMARGWLHGRAAGAAGGTYGDAARARVALRSIDLDDSDALSRACGVEPPTTGRHTASGTCGGRSRCTTRSPGTAGERTWTVAFRVFGTGHPLDDDHGKPVGTAITAGGSLVWHLFGRPGIGVVHA